MVCLLNGSLNVYAQRIDHTASFRNIHEKKYFRFHYDNDFFTKSDRYYSQGITLEYVHPRLSHFPLSKLLLKSRNSNAQYKFTFNLFGFTPSTIKSDTILFGDRPYFAAISIGSHLISIDTIKRKQVGTSLYIGIFGPAGLGKEIQANIHRWLGNPQPHGWQYQVSNDLIINYEFLIEKQLASSTGHFALNGIMELQAGTLNNKLATGVNFMAGNFTDPYQRKITKAVEYYFFSQAKGSLVGYDASLQGGIFNRKSPYTISSNNLNRFTYQADAGIVVNFKKVFLSYTQSFLTKEFQTGKYHRWGGVSAGCTF
ncbi:MAG: lipid A deacylase LpxR family protein [Ferruginibacter sp.]